MATTGNHKSVSHWEGKKVGKWTCIRFIPRTGKVLCRCACGVEQTVWAANLIQTTSTRCRECAHKLPYGEAFINNAIRRYQNGAKRRGHAWELTRDQAKQLFASDCYYCGALPSEKRIADGYQFNGYLLINGIDRIDNRLGYVSGNCVACCTICNYMKHSLSSDDFVQHILRAARHLQNQGETEPVTFAISNHPLRATVERKQ